MPPRPIRILIVDDYEPFQRFIMLSLQIRGDVQIVSAASDGVEAVNKARELRPDLILLDIGLPKLNGIEAARRIHKVSENSKILFVSQERSIEIIQEAIYTGAHGFLLKTDAGSELNLSIDTVIAGGHFVSSTIAAHSFKTAALQAKTAQCHSSCTASGSHAEQKGSSQPRHEPSC